VETPADLADAVAYGGARARAERVVPLATLEAVEELGLRVVGGDEDGAGTGNAGLAVERE
jgi:hypothetical protein